MSDAAGEAAARAARDAARERQSHVRHELRGPLAVMLPAVSLLIEGSAGPLTDKQREYLEALERSVARLERLLASALDSGWSDCSAAPAMPVATVLTEAAAEAMELRALDPEAGGPPPRLTCDECAPVVARVDRDDLRQIVAGLLDNACAYTPDGGAVTIIVSAGAITGVVALTVADTGCGIPAHELEDVFTFGYRGAAAAERGISGLGAGLWVCRELARRNGGDVALTSGEGGTSVTVTLPAASR